MALVGVGYAGAQVFPLAMLPDAAAVASLFLIAGWTLAPAAAADKMRIIFITHGQAGDPYWNAIKNGLAEAAKVYNADVRYEAPDTFDMVKMSQLIDAAVTHFTSEKLKDATETETPAR